MTDDACQAQVQIPAMPELSTMPEHPTKSSDGISVTFTDVSYTVPLKKKQELKILDDVSGHFQPGRLVALMGPSGSGKTTLMDVLAFRKTGAGKMPGEVLYNGARASSKVIQDVVGYVEQFDTLVDELTVEQMLMYTAELKLPTAMSRADKRNRVNEVLATLRLEKCRGTVIGNKLCRGISGGQAKRVNIALALVTRPKVIFLDEPTSGLDSRMANEVCTVLAGLAKSGCTVMATVHSPTSYAFSLFDDLLMLQGGGKVVYQGAVKEVKSYFEAAGHKMSCDISYSLPDWLTDLTGAPADDVDVLGDAASDNHDFAAAWLSSETCQTRKALHAEQLSAVKAGSDKQLSSPVRRPGQLHALRTLLAYRMGTHYRSGEFLGPRIGDKIFMSLLTLSLYWGIGDKQDIASIQSTAAVLFFFTALCGYGAAAFVPSLTLERALFFRERADGCYSPVTYYAAKFIEEAVLCIFTSLLFTVIVFFGMSLQGSFLIFAVIYFLTSMTGIVLAYAVASIAPNMEAANALLPTYVTTCMYFGGLFLVFDKIPMGWQWYSYTSFLRYAWGALMLNQFRDNEIGDTRAFWDDEAGEPITVLEFYGMSTGDGIMENMGALTAVLAGLCVIFGVLGALGVTYVSHVKR